MWSIVISCGFYDTFKGKEVSQMVAVKGQYMLKYIRLQLCHCVCES